MRKGFNSYYRLTAALALAGCISVAMAQEAGVKPRFAVLPAKPAKDAGAPAAALTTWNGSFTYSGTTYKYNMVGTSPKTGATTTVTAVIIPLKFVVTVKGKQYTFDPSTTLPNGKTVTQNTIDSPIFDSTTTYVQGGVNVGTTQYLDAFQRANFWGVVSKNQNYHVLLTTQLAAEQTLTPPANKGFIGKPFGTIETGEVDINWTDTQLQAIITKLGITADQFPVFIGKNVYLTEGGCCIGGYHSAVGSQSYTYATYVTNPGDFSQDVSALSHEIGEWVDDPLTVNSNGNPVQCGILEVGDPLENNANYGGYPYVLNGFTYNLQDLVTLPYFGANPATSVNKYFTFQGEKLSVCQNGG
jgi:hypothetical protein